jgi:hypothetical protein
MAHASVTAPASEWIERYLDVLIMEWAGFPALAEEWPDWDEFSKLTFVEDWGSRNVMLADLRAWAASGAMSCDQYERYRELLALIEKYDALREQLFES